VKIEVINENDEVLFDALANGVREHINESFSDEKTKPLSIIARDNEGKLIGGVSGRTIFRNFLIGVLWVDKVSRGTGLGRQLMEIAEDEAKKRGCLVAQVDTLDFQAPIFYQKLGFEIVGTVPAFSGSPERYFLLKNY